MQAIRDLKGNILGYTLPPEFDELNKLTKMVSVGGKSLGFILPPEFKEMKELIELKSVGGKSLGFILPTDPLKIQKVTNQFIKYFKNSDIASLNESISKIQSFIKIIEKEKGISTHHYSQELSQIPEKLDNRKKLSLSDIIAIITLLSSIFFQLIQSYPAIKEIYKDLTYDPISEICGAISELEREAVKFVEVDHRGGIDIYQYPKGKKSVDFVLNGTQLCMLTEPKGNTKRVKVVFQLENHKQIIGYVDRNKLKRLYKNE